MTAKNNTHQEAQIMACKQMAYVKKRNGKYYYDDAEYEIVEVMYFQLDTLPTRYQTGSSYLPIYLHLQNSPNERSISLLPLCF